MGRHAVLAADVLRLGEVVAGCERMLKVVLYLLVRVPLDLLIQVRYALCAVENRLAYASVRVRVDRDLYLVLAHIAHCLHRLETIHRRL